MVLGGFSVVLDPQKNHLIFPSKPLERPSKAFEDQHVPEYGVVGSPEAHPCRSSGDLAIANKQVRTGPGPPGQVQDLQEHLQDVQEELQDHF